MEQVFISTKNRPNMQKNPRNLILPSILVYFRRRNVDVDMASTKVFSHNKIPQRLPGKMDLVLEFCYTETARVATTCCFAC